jgi:phosphoribosylanthranilate isomerase
MKRTRIKICGITCLADALAAVECGADALGFILYPQSKRYVAPDPVRAITRHLPPFVARVGVFVDESVEKVREQAERCGLDTLQFHGNEIPEYCQDFPQFRVLRAFRIKDANSLTELTRFNTNGWLLDSYSPAAQGGTGECFDWSLARQAVGMGKPVLLAGGLTPQNVGEAICQVRPFAVDVSSGVEASPGHKDHRKILDFVRAVHQADQLS